MSTRPNGILALEDGSVYRGLAFGASATIAGEAVFNTSMTGYQEILTDPSYFGQIVTMTAPQIGNYGISPEDNESARPQVAGFVVRELSPIVSNWRSRLSLDEFLRNHGIPGLQDVDTRAITKKLRVAGAMRCCLSTEGLSAEDAIARARARASIVGADYVKDVTCVKSFVWDPKDPTNVAYLPTGTTLGASPIPEKRFKVAAFDFGAKHTIFRKLVRHGFEVYVLPATATAAQVKELAPDGLFLSNGPGDPAALSYVHGTVRELLPHYPDLRHLPRPSDDHPCPRRHHLQAEVRPPRRQPTRQESGDGEGFHHLAEPRLRRRPAVARKSGAVVTEINLNDGTVEGLRHKTLPVFSVQYHPEAAPGPNDADPLFVDFYRLIEARKAGKI
jgi:carbamoyl-phosphate synthase small subunit